MPAPEKTAVWNDGERDLLKRMYRNGATVTDITQIIRTKTSTSILDELFAIDYYNESPQKMVPFTSTEIEVLKELHGRGASTYEIARVIARSVRFTHAQALKFGLYRNGRKHVGA